MEQTIDIKSPLSQQEAGRVKSEIETIHGAKIKYRVLIGYSPKEISERLSSVKVKAEDIARYAGREQ